MKTGKHLRGKIKTNFNSRNFKKKRNLKKKQILKITFKILHNSITLNYNYSH